MTIIGLAVVFVAAVIGLVGVLANGDNTLTSTFAVFGYDVTGSTGVLFLYGIVVGAIGAAGLNMILLGTLGTSRRGTEARRELAIYKPAPVEKPGRGRPTWQQRFRTRRDAVAQPDPITAKPDPTAAPARPEPAAPPETRVVDSTKRS